jgi:hypothetical protein
MQYHVAAPAAHLESSAIHGTCKLYGNLKENTVSPPFNKPQHSTRTGKAWQHMHLPMKETLPSRILVFLLFAGAAFEMLLVLPHILYSAALLNLRYVSPPTQAQIGSHA